jgi:hypothetical protein
MSSVPSTKIGDGCTFIDRERRIAMGRTIRTLLVIATYIICFVSIQPARAQDDTVIPNPVTGKIEEADRYLSTIVIRYGEGAEHLVTIVGLPFHNLEAQLDEVWDPLDSGADGITIAAGDCVTVVYSEKELCPEVKVYKWESLTAYCEQCSHCDECGNCEGGITCEECGNCEECIYREECVIKAGEDGKCYVSSALTRLPQQNNRPKP